MKREANTLDAKSPSLALYVINMVAAVIGGLSQVPMIQAPVSLWEMMSALSYSDVMLSALAAGGFPIVCLSSIMLSRSLLWHERKLSAFLLATAPLFFAVTIFVAGLTLK